MRKWNQYPAYTPVAERKAQVQVELARLLANDPTVSPVTVMGRELANTWWGRAWNANLESYADYANRIARGRSYIRQGCILDLKIEKRTVRALVQGSQRAPYRVEVTLSPLSEKALQNLLLVCGNQIQDLSTLAQGNFPRELAFLFTQKDQGLFPSPKEIKLSCSCPDSAVMCKHVAAVLYGIGAKFDQDPSLFFTLRDLDFRLLLKKSIEEKLQSMLQNAGKKSTRVLPDASVADLFGV